MMKKALDELSSFNSWKGAVDESMGDLLLKTDVTSARLLRLEHVPPPPPPPMGLSAQIDLDQPVRLSASSSGAAAGHNSSALHREEGDGVLGPTPHPVAGSPHDSPPRFVDGASFDRDCGGRHPQLPKMEFPKFDGSNPHWWRDQCELYFEIYSVAPFLKTRFAALNFLAPASVWLQSEERRGRFQNWEDLVKAVLIKYDEDQYPM